MPRYRKPNTTVLPNCFHGHLLCAIAGLITLAFSPACRAEPVATPLTELGADLVAVKGGPRLMGAVVQRKPDGAVSIAVRREWLKTARPAYYEQHTKDEAETARRSDDQLHERIEKWIAKRPDAERLLFFLQQELKRVEQRRAKRDKPPEPGAEPAALSRFLVLEIPRERIERIFVQTPARKQAALVAWRDGLPDVETHSAVSLARRLHKDGIADVAAERVDLSDQLPPRAQDENEWAARVGIVEYSYRKEVDFQGTGDLVVRTGAGAARPDLAQVATEILKAQFGGLLDPDVLAGKPNTKTPNTKAKGRGEKWWEAATKSAEAEQVSGFRITRVNQDVAAKRVAVESRFVARMPDGTWHTVWTGTETADASKARPEIEKAITADPQVADALKLAKVAGLSLEEELQPALRAGAATMEAQQSADSHFFEFRDKYLQQLDSPALEVAPLP